MRCEQGQSTSVYVVCLLPALLLATGLAVDGGAQLAATRECEVTAASAARAAADAAASERLAGRVGFQRSQLAADRVIATKPGMRAEVKLTDERVHVRTSKQVPTLFLSVIGIGSLPSHGEATAELRRI